MHSRSPWALICIGIALILAWLFWYTQQPLTDKYRTPPVSTVTPTQHIQDLQAATIEVPIPSFHELF